jgi:hypothetical protein
MADTRADHSRDPDKVSMSGGSSEIQAFDKTYDCETSLARDDREDLQTQRKCNTGIPEPNNQQRVTLET